MSPRDGARRETVHWSGEVGAPMTQSMDLS